jgi:hypothetical protein
MEAETKHATSKTKVVSLCKCKSNAITQKATAMSFSAATNSSLAAAARGWAQQLAAAAWGWAQQLATASWGRA